MKIKGVLAVVTVALVAVVAFAASTGPAAQAKGPLDVSWDAKIGDGLTIPSAGTAVSTAIDLGIAASDTAPSDHGFFDGTRTILHNIAAQPGPGASGSTMSASDVGAKAGSISFSIQTNVIASLAGSGNIPTTGALKGLVPKCGDNHGGVRTRDWNGNGTLPAPATTCFRSRAAPSRCSSAT